MSAARAEILARIRAATRADPAAGHAAAPGRAGTVAEVDAAYAALDRPYLRAHHDPADTDIVALFAERAADYRAVIERVTDAGLPAAIARALGSRRRETGLSGFVVPDGVPAEWLAGLPADIEMLRDDPPLSPAQLDRLAGVLTGCAVAIAETGTVILDHRVAQGRRALTLVPDFHLAVVRAEQIAADLAGALARLDPVRPHTLISGPSATSDIELIRVEGVHGPRTLHILITEPAPLPEPGPLLAQ